VTAAESKRARLDQGAAEGDLDLAQRGGRLPAAGVVSARPGRAERRRGRPGPLARPASTQFRLITPWRRCLVRRCHPPGMLVQPAAGYKVLHRRAPFVDTHMMVYVHNPEQPVSVLLCRGATYNEQRLPACRHFKLLCSGGGPVLSTSCRLNLRWPDKSKTTGMQFSSSGVSKHRVRHSDSCPETSEEHVAASVLAWSRHASIMLVTEVPSMIMRGMGERAACDLAQARAAR